jgi:hypothetical protein
MEKMPTTDVPIGGARTVLRMGVSLHSERSRARVVRENRAAAIAGTA